MAGQNDILPLASDTKPSARVVGGHEVLVSMGSHVTSIAINADPHAALLPQVRRPRSAYFTAKLPANGVQPLDHAALFCCLVLGALELLRFFSCRAFGFH